MLTLWDAHGSLDDYVEPLSGWSTQGGSARGGARRSRSSSGADAHRYMHERENIGKVVLEP